jgi:hypothetical protein
LGPPRAPIGAQLDRTPEVSATGTLATTGFQSTELVVIAGLLLFGEPASWQLSSGGPMPANPSLRAARNG